MLFLDGLESTSTKGGETLNDPTFQCFLDRPLSNGTSDMGILPGIFGGNWSGVTVRGVWHAGDSFEGITPYRYDMHLNGQPAALTENLSFSFGELTQTASRRAVFWPDMLMMRSLYAADFGQEFLSSGFAKPVPEKATPIELVPELDQWRVRIPLAALPENECTLAIDFPSRITVGSDTAVDGSKSWATEPWRGAIDWG